MLVSLRHRRSTIVSLENHPALTLSNSVTLLLIKSGNLNILLHRPECFSGKDTTGKIHKNHIRHLSGLFSIISRFRRDFVDDGILVYFPLKHSRRYNKKNITRKTEDMNFIFSRQKQCFTPCARSKYVVLQIKPISSRHRVISPEFRHIFQ